MLMLRKRQELKEAVGGLSKRQAHHSKSRLVCVYLCVRMAESPAGSLSHPPFAPLSISVSLTVSISSSSQCISHARTIYAPPIFLDGAMVSFVSKIETQKDKQNEGVEVLVWERADGQVSRRQCRSMPPTINADDSAEKTRKVCVCVCVCVCKRRIYYRNSLARAVRRDASSISRRTRSACAWSFGLVVLASRAASDSLRSPIVSVAYSSTFAPVKQVKPEDALLACAEPLPARRNATTALPSRGARAQHALLPPCCDRLARDTGSRPLPPSS